MGEDVGGAFDGDFIRGVFPARAPEKVAGVGDFSGDEGARERGGGGGVVGAAVLFSAKKNVAAGHTDHVCQMFSVFGKEGECDARFGAGAEEERRTEHVTETDNTRKIEQGQAETHLLFDFDDDSFTLFVKIGSLGGDVEGVEETAHVGG